MTALKILLLGETWVTHAIHQKGAATYTTGEYNEGHQPLTEALAQHHDVTVVPNHLATNIAPWTAEEWDEYDVVILSDIAADTLLLHADPFVHGKAVPNRLGELARWVKEFGGGVLMVGGYMSFSGFEGKANFHFTPLAPALPVGMYGFDDRVERPEGISPSTVVDGHPLLDGVSTDWPIFLGYNKLIRRADSEVLVEFEGDPFLAVRQFGEGRTTAFASDCSPHWGSPQFLAWESYAVLWDRMVRWTAGAI
ncbi:glutamine amidotransferase [Microbacterium sp.]|uniref:glutamine amidotransferase n=1 Tax=Microbacterium sp. TaxID=51671 RepID=UPI003C746369